MSLAPKILVGVLLITLNASIALGNGQAKSLGSPLAKKGGTFQISLNSEPTSLNPFSSNESVSSSVQAFVLDALMERNDDTYEWEPSLAEKYETSKDGKSFTFYLRKGATFHDGKPITPQDVKFSFDAIFDDRYKAAVLRNYYENIDKAEIVGKNAVKFTIKKPYFNNFNVVAGLSVVPKHVYGDPTKKINKKLIGSGPYSLKHGKYKRGKSIMLKKNKNWWGNKVAHYKGKYNFDSILFRFIKEENIELENLKKGRIDFASLSPEAYEKKTTGKLWGTRLKKVKAESKAPVGYGFIAWNLKEPKFQDVNVRRALAHLMNRELMIKKFLFSMYTPATGPWYQRSDYADKSVKPIPFDPAAAKRLLTKAGWKDTDKNGILDKVLNGKKTELEFNLMFSSPDYEKYYTVYKEDLKKNGIICNLKRVEWNSLVSALNERKFDAITLAWTASSVDNDPKQIWHSDSMKGQGSNFNSYSNKEVDKLIEKGRQESDKPKRIKIYKKIYKKIADDAPYIFLWNRKYTLYAHTNKVKKPKDTYQFGVGTAYWWTEPK